MEVTNMTKNQKIRFIGAFFIALSLILGPSFVQALAITDALKDVKSQAITELSATPVEAMKKADETAASGIKKVLTPFANNPWLTLYGLYEIVTYATGASALRPAMKNAFFMGDHRFLTKPFIWPLATARVAGSAYAFWKTMNMVPCLASKFKSFKKGISDAYSAYRGISNAVTTDFTQASQNSLAMHLAAQYSSPLQITTNPDNVGTECGLEKMSEIDCLRSLLDRANKEAKSIDEALKKTGITVNLKPVFESKKDQLVQEIKMLLAIQNKLVSWESIADGVGSATLEDLLQENRFIEDHSEIEASLNKKANDIVERFEHKFVQSLLPTILNEEEVASVIANSLENTNTMLLTATELTGIKEQFEKLVKQKFLLAAYINVLSIKGKIALEKMERSERMKRDIVTSKNRENEQIEAAQEIAEALRDESILDIEDRIKTAETRLRLVRTNYKEKQELRAHIDLLKIVLKQRQQAEASVAHTRHTKASSIKKGATRRLIKTSRRKSK